MPYLFLSYELITYKTFQVLVRAINIFLSKKEKKKISGWHNLLRLFFARPLAFGEADEDVAAASPVTVAVYNLSPLELVISNQHFH